MLALALVDPAGAFDQVPVSTLEAFIDTVLQDSDACVVEMTCAPEEKMDLLRRMAAEGRATDLDLLPPTLDELYAHFLRSQEQAR